jgi:hypothetical protein
MAERNTEEQTKTPAWFSRNSDVVQRISMTKNCLRLN